VFCWHVGGRPSGHDFEHFVQVDEDTVAPSNRNRQLVALSSNEGQPKARVLAARLRDINPDIGLEALQQVPLDVRRPLIPPACPPSSACRNS
jgi:molybdopterin/thiamine biosynthesis adenylyltransferase